MKCPLCGEEDNSKSIRHWSYSGYFVSRHECVSCHSMYNSYTEDGKVKFTVPKRFED